MQIPNMTDIEPKSTFGKKFFCELSVRVMSMPCPAALGCRASVIFYERARWIGMIELNRGIRMPIANA